MPKRFWGHANEKLEKEREYGCRYCGTQRDLERAHIVPREYDERHTGPRGGKYRYVNPHAVIWLCGWFGNGCHPKLDSSQLDLSSVLSDEEKRHAVSVLGEGRALRRVAPLGGVA